MLISIQSILHLSTTLALTANTSSVSRLKVYVNHIFRVKRSFQTHACFEKEEYMRYRDIALFTWSLRNVFPNFLRFRRPLNLLTCTGRMIRYHRMKLVARSDFLFAIYIYIYVQHAYVDVFSRCCSNEHGARKIVEQRRDKRERKAREEIEDSVITWRASSLCSFSRSHS